MPSLLFDMQTGVAGDMVLGALFDLGLEFGPWKDRMGGLGLPGVTLGVEKVIKRGIAATRFHVSAPDTAHHRGLPEIRALLAAADLPARAKERALAVFARLAEAEASVHGIPVEQVHFHEVGALDAIVDIAGACLGFEMLGVEDFLTTPFTFGTGTVKSAHGLLAVPVPATLALSRGFPSVRTDLPGELCTPTGAALVSAFSRPVPAGWTGTLRAHGYGAGRRDLPGIANVLRICLMDAPAGADDGGEVYQVECNLDNMAPEILAYAVERLFEAGCKDAWQEPIHMKKNRSAVKLAALVAAPDLERVLAVLAAETSTGGLRWFPVRRLVARKDKRSAETRYGAVELKEVRFPGRASRLTPEYESCRKLALQAGVPLQSVYREAASRALALEAEGEGGKAG